MRLLIIGRTGQVGGELVRLTQARAEVLAPSRETLDIERSDTVRCVIEDFRPDVVINTAAFHDLGRCEREPGRAFAVNCVAVRDLAIVCRSTGARLLTFSTDYVFPGTNVAPYVEEACPAPLQIYGISRLAGENAAVAVHPNGAYVIRTCGVFGIGGAQSRGGNFIDKRIAEARSGKRLAIASEQIVSPTSAVDLATALLALLSDPHAMPGIYHLVNEGSCSWYQLTARAIELLEIRAEVLPVDRGGLDPSGFRRPRYSALANTAAAALGIRLPTWESALKRYLQQRY